LIDTANRPLRRRWFFRFGGFAIALALMAMGALYIGAQRQPRFYVAALKMDDERGRASGDQFEYQMLNLQNDLQKSGFWMATFTESQINGWLANDLLEKFPQALPEGVEAPRVAISENRLELGFRLTSSAIHGVVSLGGELFCTETPNEIGFRLHYVRVGWLPLPIGRWADNIASHFNAVGLPMRWTEIDGATTALIQLPTKMRADNSLSFCLSAIELGDERLRFGGYTSGDRPLGIAVQELLQDSLSRFSLISKLQELRESRRVR
jgi:hypothetical protein